MVDQAVQEAMDLLMTEAALVVVVALALVAPVGEIPQHQEMPEELGEQGVLVPSATMDQPETLEIQAQLEPYGMRLVGLVGRQEQEEQQQ